MLKSKKKQEHCSEIGRSAHIVTSMQGKQNKAMRRVVYADVESVCIRNDME